VLREQVKELLIGRIIRGELGPGAALVETRIAQELGVSQAPVREAAARSPSRCSASSRRSHSASPARRAPAPPRFTEQDVLDIYVRARGARRSRGPPHVHAAGGRP